MSQYMNISPDIKKLVTQLMEEGNELRDKGNRLKDTNYLIDALENYLAVLKIEPENLEASLNRCQIYFLNGDDENTLYECNRALQYHPDNVKLWSTKAEALRNLAIYEELLETSEKLIEFGDLNGFKFKADALNIKGDKQKQEEYYHQALEEIEKVLKIQPTDSDALLIKGYALAHLNNILGAEGIYEEIIQNAKLDKMHSLAWKNKCIVLHSQNKYSETIEACNRAIELNQEDVLIRNIKAGSLIGTKDYRGALETAEEVLNLDPPLDDYLDALTIKAEAQYNLGLYYEALLTCLHKKLEIDNQESKEILNKKIFGLMLKVKALDQLDYFDYAIEESTRLLDLDRENPDGLVVRSRAYNMQNKYSKALADAERVLDAIKDNSSKWYSDAMFNKGFALGGLNQYDEAIVCFNDLVENSKNNLYDSDLIKILYWRSLAYLRLNDFKNALDGFNQVIEKDPNNKYRLTAPAYTQRGNALINLPSKNLADGPTNIKAADESWQKAMSLDKEDAGPLIAKGYHLFSIKDYQKAKEAFLQAKRISPLDQSIDPMIAHIEGVQEAEVNYHNSLSAYRQDILAGTQKLVSSAQTYLTQLLDDFRDGLNTVMTLFVIQFVLGIVILSLSLFFGAIGTLDLNQTILGVAGGMALIVSLVLISPFRIQKNRVDFSQWMMAYFNWTNTFLAVNDLYAKKALKGEDSDVDWNNMKSLHKDLYELTENTIKTVEKYCEFAQGRKDDPIMHLLKPDKETTGTSQTPSNPDTTTGTQTATTQGAGENKEGTATPKK